MDGIIGRRPAHGTQCSVDTSGKNVFDTTCSDGLIAVVADVQVVAVELCRARDMRKRFLPRRDVTTFAPSSSTRLTHGAAFLGWPRRPGSR